MVGVYRPGCGCTCSGRDGSSVQPEQEFLSQPPSRFQVMMVVATAAVVITCILMLAIFSVEGIAVKEVILIDACVAAVVYAATGVVWVILKRLKLNQGPHP